MTTAFVDFNGVVPEKFDAVKLSHLVDAEYGNQGIDFKMVPREGFGWMNSAYQVGLTFMTSHMRRAVAACTSPEVFFGSASQSQPPMLNANVSAVDPLGLAMENLSGKAGATARAQGLQFQLRHIHAISRFAHVAFSDIQPRAVDIHPNESHSGSYTIQPRRITSFRPRSFQEFHEARTRSLYLGQSQPSRWDEEEIIGPNVESRETLLELARMSNNAYVSPNDPEWYDLGKGWKDVSHPCSPCRIHDRALPS
ncbi:hypothetical protein C0993_005016 [Termitomyces sp. T159_Od127]|nr:hypothetical protein C0993_005016 [Termitomyces sp. T159_Od127]